MIRPVYNLLKKLHDDSLYRNSFYLMASTFAMAFFGFFFWIINARLYSPESVGISTSLISVITLLSTISLFGFNNGIVSYLPKETKKNHMINTMFTFTGVAGVVIASIFLIGLPIFAPKLLFIRSNPLFIIGFIILVVLNVWNIMTDAAFLAYRSTHLTFVANLFASIAKLIAPFFFIFLGGAGIFIAYVTYLIISTGLSLLLMFIRLGYKPKFDVDKKIIRQTAKFSFVNYLAGTVGMLPTLIIPIWVLNRLGAKEAAYYYMASMIMNFLYVIPMATARSLFAEGSNEKSSLKTQTKKAIVGIFAVVLPAVFIIYFFGGSILAVFGKKYSLEGLELLKIFALSTLFVSSSYLMNSILIIYHQVFLSLAVVVINTVAFMFCLTVFPPKNLAGIGVYWILMQLFIAVSYGLVLLGRANLKPSK